MIDTAYTHDSQQDRLLSSSLQAQYVAMVTKEKTNIRPSLEREEEIPFRIIFSLLAQGICSNHIEYLQYMIVDIQTEAKLGTPPVLSSPCIGELTYDKGNVVLPSCVPESTCYHHYMCQRETEAISCHGDHVHRA